MLTCCHLRRRTSGSSRVSWGPRVPLAERLDVLHLRDKAAGLLAALLGAERVENLAQIHYLHTVVANQVHQRILQHRAVSS